MGWTDLRPVRWKERSPRERAGVEAQQKDRESEPCQMRKGKQGGKLV